MHACLAQNKQLTAMLAEQAAWPAEGERRVNGVEGPGAGEGPEGSPIGPAVTTHELLEAKAEAARLQQRVEELSLQYTTANAKCGDLLQVSLRVRGFTAQMDETPTLTSAQATLAPSASGGGARVNQGLRGEERFALGFINHSVSPRIGWDRYEGRRSVAHGSHATNTIAWLGGGGCETRG